MSWALLNPGLNELLTTSQLDHHNNTKPSNPTSFLFFVLPILILFLYKPYLQYIFNMVCSYSVIVKRFSDLILQPTGQSFKDKNVKGDYIFSVKIHFLQDTIFR